MSLIDEGAESADLTPRSREVKGIERPEFGSGVARRATACTPRELYQSLRDPENNVHYFEAAYTFALDAVTSPELPGHPRVDSAASLVDELEAAARAQLHPSSTARCSSVWPARVAREFGPSGLVDGAWLQGLTCISRVEGRAGMTALRQFMTRCGDPGTAEAYPQRYEALLRSLGVPPGSIVRWHSDATAPCADISYEHALLGLSLGLFPGALGSETVGFNLWMATVGPCPLLEQLAAPLREMGACLSYLDVHDRRLAASLAKRMAAEWLEEAGADAGARLSRGFFAAQRSYLRWQRAMSGGNVPMTPRDSVVEIVEKKAPFAIGHHSSVRVGGCPMHDYFAGGRSAHENLVAQLAKSHWVRPGAPDRSLLLTSVISIDGPMFDIFTASEQIVLREWVERLGTADDVLSQEPFVPVAGTYIAPQDPDDLQRYAIGRFRRASDRDLMFNLVNADMCPPIRPFARWFAENALTKVRGVLQTDARLSAISPPKYSEEAAAEMLMLNHSRNVEMQDRQVPTSPTPGIGSLLDGCWLQGFADVSLAGVEEQGWLFRIYASEMGDGHLEWNHNYIARQMHQARERRVMLPATDRRLYDAVSIGVIPLVYMSMALNTRHFLPELLGLNLAIEAIGVCGWYIGAWKRHEREGDRWAALYHRLHNSIDNYASGHTKWSLAAVQAFMARVNRAAPEGVEPQWRRIWQMWRLLEIQAHGTPAEIDALKQDLGAMALESFVPSAT